MVNNHGTKQRGQRILGDCWQWQTNGQCSKGDNCSFRHDINKRGKVHHQIRLRILSCSRMSKKHREPEVPEERVPVVECLDGPARITSKELAPIHHVKSGTLQNACSTRRFGGKCSYAHRQVDEQPSKRSKKNGDKSAVAMLKKHGLYERTGRPVVCNSSNTRKLGCVFQDMESPKSSILRKSSDMQKPIQRVKFTKAIARHTKI